MLRAAISIYFPANRKQRCGLAISCCRPLGAKLIKTALQWKHPPECEKRAAINFPEADVICRARYWFTFHVRTHAASKFDTEISSLASAMLKKEGVKKRKLSCRDLMLADASPGSRCVLVMRDVNMCAQIRASSLRPTVFAIGITAVSQSMSSRHYVIVSDQNQSHMPPAIFSTKSYVFRSTNFFLEQKFPPHFTKRVIHRTVRSHLFLLPAERWKVGARQ